MSRIDEALRRAADQAEDADGADVPLPHPLTTQDSTVLEHEPYPEEAEARPDTPRPAAADPVTITRPEPSPADGNGHKPESDGPSISAVFERIDSSLAEKTVADASMSGVSREQYRRVAAILHDAQASTGLRVIMICSAVPGEGKTLTAANLALTLSESYQRRVLLVDADLRKPSVHEVFHIDSAVGLTSGLDPANPAKLTVHQMTSRLSILPAGRPTSDPMAALTSDRMRRLLDEAKASFDWVIVDTPPLMLLPDAHLLASMVDGAVLVIRAGSTPHDLARRTVEAIGRTRIVGVILNQAEPSKAAGYNGYYYYDYLSSGAKAKGKDLARR
jgi:capsular exopolysaccharide synthesis family protein